MNKRSTNVLARRTQQNNWPIPSLERPLSLLFGTSRLRRPRIGTGRGDGGRWPMWRYTVPVRISWTATDWKNEAWRFARAKRASRHHRESQPRKSRKVGPRSGRPTAAMHRRTTRPENKRNRRPNMDQETRSPKSKHESPAPRLSNLFGEPCKQQQWRRRWLWQQQCSAR